MRRGIAAARTVVNQTRVQQADLKKYFGREGLIVKSMHPVPPPARKEVGPRLVLWLAGPSPRKQPGKFLELASSFAARTDWRFLLVGGPDGTDEGRALRAAAGKPPNTAWEGPVPFEATEAYFSRASIFVNTSLPEAEGLPNTFVQAWLAGTPVVSLHADPDGVLRSGDVGFWAGGEESRLREHVRTLMDDDALRARMGENARRFAAAEFGPAEIGDRYESLFEPS